MRNVLFWHLPSVGSHSSPQGKPIRIRLTPAFVFAPSVLKDTPVDAHRYIVVTRVQVERALCLPHVENVPQKDWLLPVFVAAKVVSVRIDKRRLAQSTVDLASAAADRGDLQVLYTQMRRRAPWKPRPLPVWAQTNSSKIQQYGKSITVTS